MEGVINYKIKCKSNSYANRRNFKGRVRMNLKSIKNSQILKEDLISYLEKKYAVKEVTKLKPKFVDVRKRKK